MLLLFPFVRHLIHKKTKEADLRQVSLFDAFDFVLRLDTHQVSNGILLSDKQRIHVLLGVVSAEADTHGALDLPWCQPKGGQRCAVLGGA